MIGNDIVDLALAKKESNWNRQRFLDKVFTPLEQKRIQNFKNPEHIVWQFWTMKESCYKIQNRKSGERIFNPIQYECFQNTVSFEDIVFYTKTQLTSDFIYTIATTSLDDFDCIFHLDNRENITKIDDFPFWNCNLKNKINPASITHHGRFEKLISLEK